MLESWPLTILVVVDAIILVTEDTRHDFEEFLQLCTSFQGLLTRMEPSLTVQGFLFANMLNDRCKLTEDPNCEKRKQAQFFISALVQFFCLLYHIKIPHMHGRGG